MRYELIKNSDVGVITDPTPILRDIKDTFPVSFVLPEPGAYVALFRDESGVEYRATIKDGVAKVPKQLLGKEQLAGLTVCQVSDDAILHTWECHPLKIGTFLSLRQTQWQITAGLTDKEIYARITELERQHATAHAEMTRCASDYAQAAREYAETRTELTKALASVKKANETLAENYNKAVEVINDLSGRVTALEKNYDPTIIK